jgi:hypothetical protein
MFADVSEESSVIILTFEDEGSAFFRNVDMASHPRRGEYSILNCNIQGISICKIHIPVWQELGGGMSNLKFIVHNVQFKALIFIYDC